VKTLLNLDLRKLLQHVERLCSVKLPRRVIEVALVEDSMLYVKFREPRGSEVGEPLHPLIHVFKDSESGEITALEIIDLDTLLSELESQSPWP